MHTKYKGYVGEFIAALLLMLKGFKILARRYKTSCGEIDIIAKRGELVIFVEVKVRKDLQKCFDAITERQIQRIRRASEIFLQKCRWFGKYQIRYDVVLIAGWRWPMHVENVTL
ncbi:MAG: YraN family protein [Holosporaceae bacterium]|jgi:putative endonuclease|nr:YraN family protein [Holosporaceae bacterium]